MMDPLFPALSIVLARWKEMNRRVTVATGKEFVYSA
jgi:hypothetical protein